jgi:hypothetical protein
MSRGKKRQRPGWQERQRRGAVRPQGGSTAARDDRLTDDELLDEIAQDTTAIFTCSDKIAADFASSCRKALADLGTDLQFARLGLEMWQGRSGRAQELADALKATLAEHERRREALVALCARFDALAADGSWHEHLDPLETWRALVRERLAAIEDSPA